MELKKVQRAAEGAALAREKLDLSIREAHLSGESLRKIAEAAGVSHEQVRRTISQDQT